MSLSCRYFFVIPTNTALIFTIPAHTYLYLQYLLIPVDTDIYFIHAYTYQYLEYLHIATNTYDTCIYLCILDYTAWSSSSVFVRVGEVHCLRREGVSCIWDAGKIRSLCWAAANAAQVCAACEIHAHSVSVAADKLSALIQDRRPIGCLWRYKTVYDCLCLLIIINHCILKHIQCYHSICNVCGTSLYNLYIPAPKEFFPAAPGRLARLKSANLLLPLSWH